MPKLLPPYKLETPEYTPGMSISVQPMSSKHAYWLEDYEYYDQLGQDPLQVRRIWGISDPKARVQALQEVLEEYPKQMHRRQLLFKATRRGDEDMVRYLVEVGTKVHVDAQKAQEEEENDEEENDEEENDEEENDEEENDEEENDEEENDEEMNDEEENDEEMNDEEENDEEMNNEEENDEEDNDGADDTDLPDKDDSSVAPVHLAAAHGQLGCLKIFIESGVDVDVLDEFGRTPFHAAALSDNTEIMKYLLDQGADPTARAAENDLAKEYFGVYAGANALELTATFGNIEILKLLLEKPGVEVTPLAIKSVANGGYEALRLLLEREGFEFDEQKNNVRQPSAEMIQAISDATPYAIEDGDLASIKFLLGYQYPAVKDGNVSAFEVPADLHKPFTYGAYSAVIHNQADKFEFIQSLGLKEHDTMSLDTLPEAQLINIQHLFDKAAEAGSIECARLLIEKHDANPNKYRVPPAVLPLYWAAANDKPEMVQYLLEKHKVDIHLGNGRFAAGPTALWIAIVLQSFESIKHLLQHGGPIDHIDEEISRNDDSLDAVLIAHHNNARVEFKTEANAQGYITSARNNYSAPNPQYVRVVLGSEDKSWISQLQHRRPDEELRERGEGARELNKEEAADLKDLEATDMRRHLADFPTFEERANELAQDDDLIPLFDPAFVPV